MCCNCRGLPDKWTPSAASFHEAEQQPEQLKALLRFAAAQALSDVPAVFPFRMVPWVSVYWAAIALFRNSLMSISVVPSGSGTPHIIAPVWQAWHAVRVVLMPWPVPASRTASVQHQTRRSACGCTLSRKVHPAA